MGVSNLYILYFQTHILYSALCNIVTTVVFSIQFVIIKNNSTCTGVGSMIGLRSGKVIAYSTRNKRCAVCQAAERSGRKATSHDCRLNWSGSSKAMEPDVAAELANNSGKYGAQISVLVGDDDSATIKKVRESVQHDVDKWSDIVHAKRSLATSLYALQPKHKRVLSGKVIEYLLKCFGYALKQNKDNVEGLKTSLRAIVPHAFGNHKTCSISWCGYLKNPSAYTHGSLPYGKDLHGQELENDLREVVEIFVPSADKLAPLGSSQANEALNNTIGSKAPKIRHYGSSESNDFRVACAVSQKNVGHSYVAEVRTLVHIFVEDYNKFLRV